MIPINKKLAIIIALWLLFIKLVSLNINEKRNLKALETDEIDLRKIFSMYSKQ